MEILFRIEMLGRFAVWQGNREITRFRTQKTASLLAYLALYPNRSHPRELLIEHFWPESTLDAARTNIRVALNALRRQLEPPGVPAGAVLIADPKQVRLNPLAFTSDVEDFEGLLQEAQAATEPQKRLECGKAAVVLYHGDLLPGHYEEWVLPERDRLQEAFCAVLRQLIKENVEARNVDLALVYAHRLVQADPLREESYRQLMRLYAALGRPAEALVHYHELERLLRKELQTTPSSGTRDLAEQLRQVAPQSGKVEKGHAAAFQAKQASAADPAARIDSKPLALKVPLQFTRFFGREEAIAQIVETLNAKPKKSGSSDPMLSDSYPRLVSLTGPGGTGKTRLSVEVARRIKEAFTGGIWFVALAELENPALIGETIREALELPPDTRASALEQVITYLNLQPPCLFILDNFEQIAAGGAPVIWTLLQRVSSLYCLVTSRLPLSLPGEWEIPVPPLPIPTLESPVPASSLLTTHLLTYPSVALFVDRAQAARSYFQITPGNALQIAAICQKLEGIPLAIELAAARVKTLTPSQILERLSERFELLASKKGDKGERHRSLWAAIDWSYHLLAPGLQRFFARLSVFRGGWTLEAAEQICEEALALDYLGQLRAHSLILVQESTEAIRFKMLETIREFAGEVLPPDDRVRLSDRHRDYFLAFAEEMEKAFLSADQVHWRQQLEQEHDNLRASLQWCQSDKGSQEAGLQLAGSLWRFWDIGGYWSEGRQHLHTLLSSEAACSKTPARAKALHGAGSLAQRLGDYAAARALYEQSLAIETELEDKKAIAASLNGLGNVAIKQGDYAAARAVYEQSLTMEREREDKKGIALSLGNLGHLLYLQGDYVEARALHEQSLAIERELGDKWGIANALYNLGNAAKEQNDYAAARALYEQCLAIRREIGDKRGIANALLNLGTLAKEQGDYVPARALYEQCLAMFKELGDRQSIAGSLLNLGNIAGAQDDSVGSRAFYEQSLAIFEELGDKQGMALSLGNLGNMAGEQGDYAAARTLYEQCLAIETELGDRWGVAFALNGLGVVAAGQGDCAAARILYAESLAISREIGDRWGTALSLHNLGYRVLEQGDFPAARALYAESLAIRNEIGDKQGIACSLQALAELAARQEQAEWATRLWAAAGALREAIGYSMPSNAKEAYDRMVMEARSSLGEPAFSAAWEQGRAMPIEQAIEYAQQEGHRESKERAAE